jgi:hypothetical protein
VTPNAGHRRLRTAALGLLGCVIAAALVRHSIITGRSSEQPRTVAPLPRDPVREAGGLETAEPRAATPDTIAVLEFTAVGDTDLSAGLAELLELELRDLGLVILERRQLRFVLSERRLQRGGLVRAEDVIREKLPWVRYLVGGQIEAHGAQGFEIRVSLADAQAGSVVAEFREAGRSPEGLAGSICSLARRLAAARGGVAVPPAERRRVLGMSSIPEVVLRLHQGLDYLFAGLPEVAIAFFREASELDPSFVVARIWEAKAYEALDLPDNARLIHEMVRLVHPDERPEALRELREGLGVRTVAVTHAAGEPVLSRVFATQLVNRLAATKGLRAFRSDWIQGLTDEMDLELTEEFASASGLGDRSWLLVDLIASVSVQRDGDPPRLRVDVIRAMTGELLQRVEHPVPAGGGRDVVPPRTALDDALRACLANGPGAATSAVGRRSGSGVRNPALAPRVQGLPSRMRKFAEALRDHVEDRADKLRMLVLFKAYPEVSPESSNDEGSLEFLHQVLLLRRLLTTIDEAAPEAATWLATALWLDRGLRLREGACRTGTRPLCANARTLLGVVDREWPPAEPFAYVPLHGTEIVPTAEGQTTPGEPLGRAFTLLTRKYPNSLAAELVDYSLAIDRMNRGDHAGALGILRGLIGRLSRRDIRGLRGDGKYGLQDSYFVSLFYFAALEAKGLGERDLARDYARQALGWVEKHDQAWKWPAAFGPGKSPLPVLGTMAIQYEELNGALTLWFNHDGAIPGGGGEPFRPRLASGKIAEPHYDLRVDLESLSEELGLAEAGSGERRAVTAQAQRTAVAGVASVENPEQVQAVLRGLCGCRIRPSQGGRPPYWGYLAEAFHEARMRATDPAAIDAVRSLGRRYLDMLSPAAWDYRMAVTLVLLATQDSERLGPIAEGWLASKERDLRLSGIVAKGRLLLCEGGPPPHTDFWYVGDPIGATTGRKRQAEFYFGELRRWIADFGHPAETGSYDERFYAFALRTALAFKLAAAPDRALRVYALALAEHDDAPVSFGHGGAARHPGQLQYHRDQIQSLRYHRAVLLASRGDSGAAAEIFKSLVKEEQLREHRLTEQRDNLLPVEGDTRTWVLDAALARLEGLRGDR